MARFLFRCDASAAIGVGHFMRCSTLARALERRGHHVCFAMRETTSLVDQHLREQGLERTCLFPTPSLPRELPELLRLLDEGRFDAIVVDHYGAPSGYFAALAAAGTFVAGLDDLADRDLTALDWLLNQNLGSDGLAYRVRPDCVVLLGPRYSLLRPQFLEARQVDARTFSETDSRILVTLGGGDSFPLYADVLASLNHVTRPLNLRFLVPGHRPEQREALVKLSRHTLEILHNAANMADHMAWADLSINAGGSTCWELCCLGVPMLIVVLSQDQEIVTAGLERAEAAKRLTDPNRAAALVEHLLAHPQERHHMSQRGQGLVDGLGADRAAAALEVAVAKRLGKEHENAYPRSA